MLLTKDVLQPTKNPRSIGPHKLNPKKTSKRKSHQKTKKVRSVSTKLHEEPSSIKIQSHKSAESRSGEKNMLQQRIFYTNEGLKNYSFINTSAFIPISTCRLTKTAHTSLAVHPFLFVHHFLETI